MGPEAWFLKYKIYNKYQKSRVEVRFSKIQYWKKVTKIIKKYMKFALKIGYFFYKVIVDYKNES